MLGMLRGFGWARIFLGAVTAFGLAVLLTLLIFATVDKLLYVIFISDAGPGFSVTMREQGLYNSFSAVSHAAAALLAFAAGGVVAGGLVSRYPGIQGAGSAALVVVGVLSFLAVAGMIWMQQPISGPNQEYTRSENLGNLFAVGSMFAMISPFAVLAGYLGGRFGQRILRSIADG